jgi:coenzyme F420-reducing hydrogenase delta subunit
MDEDSKPKLNVISFKKPEQTETDADINVDMVLEAAQGKLKSVIVAGWTEGEGFYFAMSQGSIAENLMIIECTKALLVEYMIGGMQNYD